MKQLASWLSQHQSNLLSRWMDRVTHNAHGTKENTVTLSPEFNSEELAAIFDGLLQGASGQDQLIKQILSQHHSFYPTDRHRQLPEQIRVITQFRLAAHDELYDDPMERGAAFELLRDLNSLLDTSIEILTASWSASAQEISYQLTITEQLAESLHEATEQADNVALQLANINEIGQALTSSLDMENLLNTIRKTLFDVMGLDQVLIFQPDEQQKLRIIHGATVPEHFDRPLGAGEGDLVCQAFNQSKVIIQHEPNAAAQGLWYQPGCSVMVLPLRVHEHTIGVMVLQDASPNSDFRGARLDFVRAVTSQAAIALENARLYAELRDFNTRLEDLIAQRTHELQSERDMLETLHQIALEVSSTLDLSSLLQNCLDRLADLIGVVHGSVMLFEPDTEQLVDRAVLGGKAEGHTRFALGMGVVGWVAQHKQAALIPDINVDERWISLPHDDEERKTGGSMIAVPLMAHHDLMGVILLSHPQEHYFLDQHLRLLNASAGEIALGIYNAMLYDHIQQELMRQGERLRNERRATAQSYAILQSLSDGVIVCNAEGSVIAANPAATRTLSWEVEDLLTWHLPDLLARLLSNRTQEMPIEELLQNPIDPHGNSKHYTTTFRLGKREVFLSLDPVTAGNDESLGAVAVFRDITREVESERLKDQFIGTVSHELRTPMTSIKGYTQLMAMGSLGPLNDTQKEFLNTINVNAERMISIINDLLDITKIETGSILRELHIQPMHLAEALSGVLPDLQPQIQARDLTLSLNIPTGFPSMMVDGRRFNQILKNLLSNAAKFTLPGGQIELTASEVSDKAIPVELREGLTTKRFIQIDVRDTGVGIPLEEHSKIFERFYRAENPLKIEAGGTGLGLSLVRSLVQLFGGRIWLDSLPDVGSTFSFVIPAA